MKFPETEHYAIITVNQRYVPGDRRSQESPGHGYPEHYEEEISYQSYDTVEELEFELLRKTDTFKVVKVTPLKYETKVSVKIK